MPEGTPDRIIFDSGLVRIGAFRCAPHHPAFEDSGPARNFCFVFPRTAVEIEHEHEPAFVANPNIITFYNDGQPYRRRAISLSGDRCDWFGVDPATVRDAIRPFDPTVDERPHPFRLTRAFSQAQSYLLQRQIFRRAASADSLAIEEAVMILLEEVVASAYATAAQPRPVPAQHRDLIHDVEVILSRSWDSNLRLTEVARQVDASVYHLCRTFRQVTGRTLHQYRQNLRVRTSLEPVSETTGRLLDIAMENGFSSHSHFTECFRHEFGLRPSEFRDPS